MHRQALWLRGLGTALCAAALGAATFAVGAPAASKRPARLAYLTDLNAVRPTAWAAHADGSHRVRLGMGASETFMAPDGRSVAIVTPPSGGGSALVVVPSGGGRVRTLLTAEDSLDDQVAWSPDSTRIAAVLDDRQLFVITVATGARRVVARGQIDGFSFSPDSRRLVYARAASTALSARVNLFVAGADGSHAHAITHDGRSLFPLWGSTRIAFSRERLRSGDVPAHQLWLVRPDGHGARQLTHTREPKLESGLTAIAWSGDGRRLLAGFRGLAGIYEAWTVDVRSGHARDLTGRVDQVIAVALSHDGRTVLVQRGIVESGRTSVETIPFGGGRPTVLVRNAGSPSWNR